MATFLKVCGLVELVIGGIVAVAGSPVLGFVAVATGSALLSMGNSLEDDVDDDAVIVGEPLEGE